ncbi:HEAT repeat domain-containing protein [Streptomyces cyaneofuscatus]|uniref:HEAT repeat domain-containing protein n=1 Tax=Streptomyces cyaneofuscatus TaxID=66883 RepID=UPI0036E223F5
MIGGPSPGAEKRGKTHAGAERAVAVGGDAEIVVTGDGATIIKSLTLATAPGPATPDQASDQEVADAVARYASRAEQVYGRLDLGVLTPPGENAPVIRLTDVFVVPAVRADPPPVQLPRELERRLLEEGFGDDGFLPPGTDRESFEHLRNSYLERPEQGVLEALAGPSGERTVLLGDPGGGKSALMRYLTLLLTRGEPEEAPRPLRGLVPLMVELRQYADDRWRHSGFEDFLDHRHSDFGLGVPPSVRERLLAEGRAWVVFEGLDEIFDPQVRAEATDRMAAFSDRWPAARITVTSRVIGYQRAVLDGAGFAHFKVQDLDEERISAFLDRWYRSALADDPLRAKELAQRMTSATENSRPLEEMAGNPLLLTILAIIGSRRALPNNRREAYEQAVAVLVEHWDRTAKLLTVPSAPAAAAVLDALGPPERLELLRLLASRMQEGHSGIAGNHLHVRDLEGAFGDYLGQRGVPRVQAVPAARAMVTQLHERNFILAHYGGQIYGFVHRAFLEYLAAADIAYRYQEEGRWTPDELIEEVVAARAADPAWHEALLLLIGQLDSADATAAVDRLLELHARRRDPVDASCAVLALRALAEVAKPGALAARSVAVVGALTAVLNTRGSKGPWLLGEAWSALSSFSRYWAGRAPYLRWYRLSGQFSFSEEPAAVLAFALEQDEEELAALARGSWHGFDRLMFLSELALRRPDDDVLRGLVLREATAPSGRRVRSMALEVLGEVWHAREDVRAFLISRVTEDPAEGTRGAALHVLCAWWSDDESIRDLAMRTAIEGGHPFMRSDALRALGQRWHGDERVRSLLIRRAQDEQEENTRDTALRELERHCIGYPDVLEFLMQLAADDTGPDPSPHGIWALGEYAPRSDAIRDLLIGRASDSRHADYREAALRALAKKWPSYVGVREALVRAATADQSPDVQVAALKHLGERWSRDPRVRSLIFLSTHEDRPEQVRGAAVEVIGTRYADDDQDAPSVVVRVATDDRSPKVRRTALWTLADHWADRDEVRDLLIRACGDDEWDGLTRASVLLGLAKHWSSHQEARALVLAAADHPYRFTSANALDALADDWPDDDEALAVLMRIVAEHEDRLVGSTAMKLLATRWTDRADVGALVTNAAADPGHRYRDTALDVLSDHWAHLPGVRDVLVRAVTEGTDDTDQRTRVGALNALGLRWGGLQDTQEAFRRCAVTDPDHYVRFTALRWWVTGAGDEEGEALVGSRAAGDAHPEVRRKVLHMLALGWPSSPRTGAVLREVALNDEDEATRTAARELLSRTALSGG